MTGLVKDERYLRHQMGAYHVESPERLQAIHEAIEEKFSSTSFALIPPRPAREEEILWIHEKSYYEQLAATQGKERVILDPDTSTCSESFSTALLAAGGLMEAARAIMEGEVTNAFALIRPPGHHAEKSRAMGFCLFNNIALAAEYLLRIHSVDKILIVDWDVHHGNGTQHSFEQRSEVLYFSLHQYPHYPGTGHWEEIGAGPGKGFTINCPLSPGKGDADYLYIFKRVLKPVIEAFQPEFILVSAGFDPHLEDPLSGMQLSSQGFAALTYFLLEQAARMAQGHLLLTLEGGYALEALARSVVAVLEQLSGVAPPPQIKQPPQPQTEKQIDLVIRRLKEFWPLV
ncbi:MAG: histone deacetylase [Candidatus Aminicenantes bacterium]|mgnify:FL=1|nr:MAG: histone deacetylase [Candidatus Aminicenantes bacterium]RLE05280.1 MAG: histone deacetylase [Candidatus Aminicenantes bacterium]HHF42461.1 histone deacetylase [Candidatus Aminicenantes bacterium]